MGEHSLISPKQDHDGKNHIWFHIKSSLLNDEAFGPVEETEIIQLFFDLKLPISTIVNSPTRTGDQWYVAEQVPEFKLANHQGIAARQALISDLQHVRQLATEEERDRNAIESRSLMQKYSDPHLLSCSGWDYAGAWFLIVLICLVVTSLLFLAA